MTGKKIQRICIHWTGGPYYQTALDYTHYHYTINGDGVVQNGRYKPEANIPPLNNGRYAQHTGGGNSHTIGVALCGMAGYKNPKQLGSYPLKASQCEAAWKFIAALCKAYRIEVKPSTVYTHYEFGKQNPKSDSWGKIDIIHLPHAPTLQTHVVGDYIRDKVRWYTVND